MRTSDEMSDTVGQVTGGNGTKLERHLEQGGLNECIRLGAEVNCVTDLVYGSSRTYSETLERSRTEVHQAWIRGSLRVRAMVARRI